MLKTQFEVKIKTIRTNNKGEFFSTRFQNLLKEQGIIHQKTVPYTPQQNGVVERKHRHLLKLARSLMIEASLPKKFWSYSLLMATHIINRLLSSILKWRTPYELLYKREPNYSLLKIFGCLSYATNVSPHKTKFEQRAYKCIFIGYSLRHKAFKLYNLDTEQVIVSRDVIFYENIYPFKNIPIEKTDNIVVPLPVINNYLPNYENDVPGNTLDQEDIIDIDDGGIDNTAEVNVEPTQR